MDEGKAAGPKLNWWSRPARPPAAPAAADGEPDTGAVPAPRTAGDEQTPAARPAEAIGASAPGESSDDGAVRPSGGIGPSSGEPASTSDESASGESASDESAPSGEPASTSGEPISSSGESASTGEPISSSGESASMGEPISSSDEAVPAAGESAPPSDETGAPAGHVRLDKPGRPADPARDAATPSAGPASASGEPTPSPEEPVPPSGEPVAPANDPTPAPPPQPRHPEDPYGTPPYGGPGPWAPAPPVQRPMAAPGVPVPPGAAAQPGIGTPPGTPGDQRLWQQYDPWSSPPQQGGPRHPGMGPALPAPAKPPRNRRGLLAVGAVVLALIAGGVGGGVGAYIERNGGVGDIRLPQAIDEKGAGRDPHSVAGIAQAALPSVVTLHVRGADEQGTGTGFVLDKQGHILTNNHVVEPAGSGGEISVTFSGGETARAKVIGRDGGYDLAVVKVDHVAGLRPLPLGDSDAVRVGDPVVAIGAPYDLANTVTAGIISAKQRPITAGGRKGDGSDVSYVDALQTDAPINPGNSGGPLVDARARVIGINSAIRAADSGGMENGGQGGSIGLGFAIPINQGKWVAEELINKGRAMHPVIGVTLEMEYAGDGARVSSGGKGGGAPVTPGGPGAKAGIKPHDVITKVDGKPVHSAEELIVKIRSHRPGDRLTLTVRRGGDERTVVLTLGASSQG
ncbi:trypsin-like peptidase domain-containing protein [Streptomyces sp. NPDC003077]|uniref:trypsin-like peptidase domain-containing protein n=1 Tax=Streptomyces sp. NPDC003077 TaxID=3154443 RepID=UPI0033AB4340